jgi:hypothetical protein
VFSHKQALFAIDFGLLSSAEVSELEIVAVMYPGWRLVYENSAAEILSLVGKC